MSKKLGYISASQIKQFIVCPLLYKAMYVDCAIKTVPNEYMIYGTALHETLANNNFHKKETGTDRDIDQCMSLFENYLKADLEAEKVRIDPVLLNAFKIAAKLSLTAYLRDIAPSIKPLLIEGEFNIKLDRYPITIKGFFDLVTEDLEVIDYKTVGKAWKAEYTDTKVINSVQGNLYAVAARKLYKKKEKSVGFYVMPRGEATVYKKVFTPSINVIETVLGIASDIEYCNSIEFYQPNLASCSSCQLKDTCKKRICHK